MVALVDSDEIFVKGMQVLFEEQKIPLNKVITDYQIDISTLKILNVLIVDPYKRKEFDVVKLQEILSVNPKIRIIVIEENLDLIDDKDMLTQMILGIISMTIGLEKELMSLRTKEALTAKKLNGMSLGKPKGTIQKSKFDLQRDKIEELLAVGLSVRKISKLLGYNNHIGLNNYVKKRKIKINLNNA